MIKKVGTDTFLEGKNRAAEAATHLNKLIEKGKPGEVRDALLEIEQNYKKEYSVKG